ncbi:MAG: TonB-dependent receptor [Pseudomonadota bacterium]|nr:TonB-dependent receptor [Pseudomonadota bacterium]
MLKTTVLSAALAAALFNPLSAAAADDKELAAIRAQIKEMKDSYEARLQALEQRLQDAQAATAQAQNAALATQAPAPAPVAAPAPAASNAFNPNISLVLGGTYANLSQDPEKYRLQGFMPPSGEVGPGRRGFNLGESELTMAANIDPMFSGQLTFSLTGEDTVGVEEAFVQTRTLANGVNVRAGRFLSSIGYLNNQHAHTWDFVDAPLAYQAFLGGQYKPDGLQAKWLAPTDTLVEVGAEIGSGGSFPGNARNKNGAGAGAVYVHVGDDIGDSSSWRAGLSLLHTGAADREFDTNTFSGTSRVMIADAIYKWAPNGNPTQRNFKLQGEYFRRHENGDLANASDSGSFDSTQSGWYLQGVYQFMPNWRTGLRYDRLSSGTPSIGLAGAFPSLDAYSPSKTSVMLDYSPSEFARLRLQLARDQSRPGVTDNQVFLQYIMSLGTHAAHSF